MALAPEAIPKAAANTNIAIIFFITKTPDVKVCGLAFNVLSIAILFEPFDFRHFQLGYLIQACCVPNLIPVNYRYKPMLHALAYVIIEQ